MQILWILFIQNDLKISHIEPSDDYHYYKYHFIREKASWKIHLDLKFSSVWQGHDIKMY